MSGIDPQLPVSNLITTERQVEEIVYVDRLVTMLSAGFAALATLLAAIGLGRAAEALLFGVSGYDARVLIAAAAVLAAVVLGAGYLPARRASDIAPVEALRYE